MPSSWCTVESDPGVFTELISKFGVEGVQVEDLYTLDSFSLKELSPVYGLIFLFKWRAEKDDRPIVVNAPTDLFFANQVIPNACATQALLSILLNISASKVKIGDELTSFKNFTSSFSPELKGNAIENCTVIKEAHNSFARPEPFVMEEKKSSKEDDDVFHFISYIPHNGSLYELDGLKAGPICLGKCTDDDWLDKIVPHIQQRIEKYAQNEIKFHLMALIHDRIDLYNEKIKELQNQYESVKDNDQIAEQLMHQITDYQQRIQDEQTRRKSWTEENIRRRHNYIPFLINFIKILAEKKELLPLLEKAKEKAKNKTT